MKTDREWLELAAKAAGIYDKWPSPDYEVTWNGNGLWCSGMGRGELWNPLEDDGDAFRLLALLRIYLSYPPNGYEVEAAGRNPCVGPNNGFLLPWSTERICASKTHDAATRRAIVRAAASIAAETGLSGEGVR